MLAGNVLAAFDGSAPSQSALALAIRIAPKHDAHLTGLLTQPLPLYRTPIGAWLPAERWRCRSSTRRRTRPPFASSLKSVARPRA
jgi:hypothetical protein